MLWSLETIYHPKNKKTLPNDFSWDGQFLKSIPLWLEIIGWLQTILQMLEWTEK